MQQVGREQASAPFSLSAGRALRQHSTFWEEALLSRAGLIRRSLKRILFDESPYNFYDILPDLEYQKIDEFSAQVLFPQLHLDNAADAAPLPLEFWEGLGVFLALSKLIGLRHLNAQRMMLGRIHDECVYGPVEIQSMFTRVRQLSETGLLPQLEQNHVPALAKIKFALQSAAPESVAILIGAWCAASQLLSKAQDRLGSVIRSYNTQGLSRIELRPEAEYIELLRHKELLAQLVDDYELLPEELEQLKAGRLPYFFAKLDVAALFYFDNSNNISKLRSHIPVHRVGQQMPRSLLNDPMEGLQSDMAALLLYLANGQSLQSKFQGVHIQVAAGQAQWRLDGSYQPINA